MHAWGKHASSTQIGLRFEPSQSEAGVLTYTPPFHKKRGQENTTTLERGFESA